MGGAPWSVEGPTVCVREIRRVAGGRKRNGTTFSAPPAGETPALSLTRCTSHDRRVSGTSRVSRRKRPELHRVDRPRGAMGWDGVPFWGKHRQTFHQGSQKV